MNQQIQEPWTRDELIELATHQKNIMWMILVAIAALLASIVVPYITIVTGLIQVYFIYKLAVAVRSSVAWLYIILAFIPLVGLLGLLHINGKATKTLQANGIKVGLMGARMEDFNKIESSAQ